MNLDDFKPLSLDEKLDQIYATLTIPTKPGIGGLFGPDRPPSTPPVQPKMETPAGFTEIFGAEPDRFESAKRAVWLNKLSKFEGIVDISNDLDFPGNSGTSQRAGLGNPIVYKFDGEELVTFSRIPSFSRPAEWYYNNYFLLISLAKLRLV